MAEYKRKELIVTAQQHEGLGPLVVVSNEKGEQKANPGDFLVGMKRPETDEEQEAYARGAFNTFERGFIHVVSKEDFQKDFDLVDETPAAPEEPVAPITPEPAPEQHNEQ